MYADIEGYKIASSFLNELPDYSYSTITALHAANVDNDQFPFKIMETRYLREVYREDSFHPHVTKIPTSVTLVKKSAIAQRT